MRRRGTAPLPAPGCSPASGHLSKIQGVVSWLLHGQLGTHALPTMRPGLCFPTCTWAWAPSAAVRVEPDRTEPSRALVPSCQTGRSVALHSQNLNCSPWTGPLNLPPPPKNSVAPGGPGSRLLHFGSGEPSHRPPLSGTLDGPPVPSPLCPDASGPASQACPHQRSSATLREAANRRSASAWAGGGRGLAGRAQGRWSSALSCPRTRPHPSRSQVCPTRQPSRNIV